MCKKQKNYREKTPQSMQLWHKNNTDKEKQYKYENANNYRMYAQNRLAKGRNLPATLTVDQWLSIKAAFNNKCAYCGKELPLAQEHFVALSKDGEYAISNIIPACHSCNSSKNNKDFFSWYPKYKYYSKNREKIILKYLCYTDQGQQLTII